jgi:hypothetical protein
MRSSSIRLSLCSGVIFNTPSSSVADSPMKEKHNLRKNINPPASNATGYFHKEFLTSEIMPLFIYKEMRHLSKHLQNQNEEG